MRVNPPPFELTQLICAARDGGDDARKRLFETIYADLRQLARAHLAKQSPLTLLSPTSLVHESYARLLNHGPADLVNRRVYFAYASKVMRSVIVDYVRERSAEKRGGSAVHDTLRTELQGEAFDASEILAVHEAMVKLKEVDARCHDVVELRFFGGFTIEECAEHLAVSTMTVARDWEKARLFLWHQLSN